MRESVEAVAANAIGTHPILWQGVAARRRRQRRVKRGIEHRDHRYGIAEELAASTNYIERQWIVQRRERAQRIDAGDHLVGDASRFGEGVAAMNDAMADCRDRRRARLQSTQYPLRCCVVAAQ